MNTFRRVVLIVSLLFVPLGLLALGKSIADYRTALASKHWPAVEGRVVASGVAVRSSARGGRRYVPDVRYTYAVSGVTYEGRDLFADGYAPASRSGQARNDRSEAESMAARFPVGASVPVHHDPDRPERAVLLTGPSGAWGTGALVGSLFILAMGFFWGVAVGGIYFAVPVFAVLFVAAGITGSVVCIRAYGPGWELAWTGERTQGTVRPLRQEGRLRLVVAYRVAGESHQIPARDDLGRDYRPGAAVTVVYRRDKPEDAMIDSFEAIWFVPLVVLVCSAGVTAFGGVLLLGLGAGWLRKRSERGSRAA